MKSPSCHITFLMFIVFNFAIAKSGFSGCNDVAACNYVSTDADADNCCYDDCFVLSVGGGTFDVEVGWTIVSFSGDEVATGEGASITTLCLTEDCYTIELTDDYGDGWDNTVATLSNGDGTIIFTSSLDDGFGPQSYPWTIGVPPCSILGCIDLVACDFDSGANLEDGSCEYETCAGCLDPSYCEYDPLATIWGFGSCESLFGCMDSSSCLYDPLAGCGDQDILCMQHPNDICESSFFIDDFSEVYAITNSQTCVDSEVGENNGVWISFDTPDLPASITITCAASLFEPWDNEIVLYNGCPSDGGTPLFSDQDSGENSYFNLFIACGELNPNSTYYLMIDGNEGETGTCEITAFIDDYTCNVGCTDSEALNYDSTALFDDDSCVVADCEDPITETYCYGEENYQSFIIQGTGDTFENLSIQFLEGTIHLSPWATLTIYDGYNNSFPVIFTSYTGGGISDLTGVTLESNVGALYFEIFSNGASTCFDGEQVEWLFDIYCGEMLENGCGDPIACNYDPESWWVYGACEYSSCIECIGDLNFDGLVNSEDFTLLMSNFGCDSGCPGDTDGDGDIDIQDLVNFNNYLGVPCE